ncbi:MAG: ATPase domain-containing protein [Nitrososphaeraceae archaeon]
MYESSVVNINPGLDDLNKFIKIGNHSLLVKGRSGTGKVTLCFELARNNIDRFDVIFVSRNVSEKGLHNRFPWVKAFVKPHNILSISNLDSMLADPSFILTNIANSISNLTMKIQDPFSSLEESQRPFTILDGWEGITRELDSTARTKAEKMLTSIINRSEGFIVFLVEEIDKSSIEYLVDGVIVLNQNFYRSYRLREMQIEKLKGTHISRAKVPFTLEGGRFRTFSGLSQRHLISKTNNFVPTSHSNGFFSTGSPELDHKLNGGFKKGTVISIEIEEDVDRFVFVPILAPIILNFISQDHAAFVIPASDQYGSAVSKYITPYAPKDKITKFLRIFSSADGSSVQENSKITESDKSGTPLSSSHSATFSTDPLDNSTYLLLNTEKTFSQTFILWLNTRKKLRQQSHGCVMTIDYSFVELEYQNEIQLILKSIIEMSRLTRRSNDLLIMVSRPNYRSLDVMRSISDIHLRIFEYDGVLMLAATKPQLFLYNIQTDFSSGFPRSILQEST